MNERSQIMNIIKNLNTEPCAVSVSRYFSERYGNDISQHLQDLCDSNNFKGTSFASDLHDVNKNNHIWLNQSFDDMNTRLTHVSKEEILHSLHSIPCYLRPTYTIRSTRACRLPLIEHIQNRISFLFSLSLDHFYQILLSVFPLHTVHDFNHFTLTKNILLVEYGDVVVSTLQTSRSI